MNYYSMNDYCREHFGKKLYKLSLDGGFTCPTRDGTKGNSGCIFCSDCGSGEFAEKGEDINTQIENAKKRVASKNKNGGYIAYFQNFTNTYAPIEKLRSTFLPCIKRDDIDVLSIATRPDCLGEDVLSLLNELNKIKPVWIELGFQTSKTASVQYIRRGYENEVYENAVRNLHKIGIYVITHMIIGLPDEDIEDMKNTLNFIIKTGSDGVKLQLLHILRDADIYKDFLDGKVKVLSKEEYINILSELIPLLPKNIAVHRLTGDGDKNKLIAPLWSANKKDVINSIKHAGTNGKL